MNLQMKIKKYRLLVILVLALGLLVASTSLVLAQVIGEDGMIYACVIPSDGTIRIVSDPANCKKNEELLSWNITGQKGDPGLACWDLNGNGLEDVDEDINQDNLWDTVDCKGSQGDPGVQGDPGIQGPQGDIGPAGPAGAQGEAGPIGAQGEMGPVGPQGIAGPAGPMGEAGPAGPAGPQGDIGPAGPAGLQGDVGPAGPAGPQGEAGLAGPQGEQGLTGEPGLQGNPGPACWDLNGDSLEDPEEDINQDNKWNAMDCKGLQGEQGIPGVPGPVGPTGPVGPQGPAGPAGPQGEDGAMGATGAQGPQGEQGLPGPQGEPGPAGTGIASLDELDGLPCQVGQPGEGVIALSYDPTTGIAVIACNPTILYTLTIEKIGGINSTVLSYPAGIGCGSTCYFAFPAGRLIELSINDGDSFVGWGGACSGSGSCQVVMNSDMTVTATFATDHQILLSLFFQEFVMPPYNYIASGSVLVDGWQTCSDPYCAYNYPEGQTITFEAIPDDGSTFGGWDGVCEGEPSLICTVTIDDTDPIDMEVQAVFTLAW